MTEKDKAGEALVEAITRLVLSGRYTDVRNARTPVETRTVRVRTALVETAVSALSAYLDARDANRSADKAACARCKGTGIIGVRYPLGRAQGEACPDCSTGGLDARDATKTSGPTIDAVTAAHDSVGASCRSDGPTETGPARDYHEMTTCGRCGLPVSPGICAPKPHVFHDKPEDCIPDLRRALDAYGAAYKLWADAAYARGDKPDPWRFTDFVRETLRATRERTEAKRLTHEEREQLQREACARYEAGQGLTFDEFVAKYPAQKAEANAVPILTLHPTEDAELTCIVCGRGECDREIHVYLTGLGAHRRAALGLHSETRTMREAKGALPTVDKSTPEVGEAGAEEESLRRRTPAEHAATVQTYASGRYPVAQLASMLAIEEDQHTHALSRLTACEAKLREALSRLTASEVALQRSRVEQEAVVAANTAVHEALTACEAKLREAVPRLAEFGALERLLATEHIECGHADAMESALCGINANARLVADALNRGTETDELRGKLREAEALAEAGPPAVGSRLWRCEVELKKAREELADESVRLNASRAMSTHWATKVDDLRSTLSRLRTLVDESCGMQPADTTGALAALRESEASHKDPPATRLAADGLRYFVDPTDPRKLLHCRAVEHGWPKVPARLDESRTAEPKTLLVGHAHAGDRIGPGSVPADTHVDNETGKRTGLTDGGVKRCPGCKHAPHPNARCREQSPPPGVDTTRADWDWEQCRCISVGPTVGPVPAPEPAKETSR